MATKVGGFTKSGVVQCVKLVEEGTSSKLSSFNGTFSSSNVTCNNGFVITGYKDGTTISTDFDNIRAPLGNIIFMINPTGSSQRALFKIYGDVVNGDVATASLEPELWAGSSAEYLPTNSSDWTSNENFEISQIIIQSTGGSMINQYVPVLNRIHLSFNGQSVMYEKYAGSNPQTYYYNPTDTKFILYAKDRVTYSTVRMGKDGTLRCSKLIEEPIINLIDDYSGTAASPYNKYDKLVLNNGITLAVTKDGVPSENFFRTLVLQFSSAASTISRLFSINIMNSNVDSVTAGTAPDGSVPWEFKQDYPIDGYITVSTPGVYAAGQYVLTISDSTQSVNYSVTLDSSSTAFSFSPSTSGDYFILSYDMRMKVPTVRIGKDGTIKCAEVEEATKEPNIEVWNGTKNNLRINCKNGAVIYLMNGNNDSDLTFSIVEKFVFNFAEDLISSQVTGELRLEMASDGSCSPTIYGPSYDYNDTSFYYETTPLVVRSISLYCTNNSQLNSNFAINIKYDGSNHVYGFGGKTGNNIATFFPNSPTNDVLNFTDMPYLERVKYSWPGSTIVKATNTFITSDNKNFLTNTGDQFMVR